MPAAQPTTPEDMLEAAVLMQEDKLEDDAIRYAQNKGASEGRRWPVKINVGTNEKPKLVTVVDRTPEEKAAIATESVKHRVAKHNEETMKYAQFKLGNLNEVEAVDFIRDLPPGDRQLYLKVENEGQKRKAIFDIFGKPEK